MEKSNESLLVNNVGRKKKLFTAYSDRYGILKVYASQNRRETTDAEMVLWQYLRGCALGVKFRRQHAIGDYIVDFFCLKKNLIVEVDGGYHLGSEQKENDNIRSANLNKMGYYVMRFTNEEVLNDTSFVIGKIKEIIDTINIQEK